MSDACGAHHGHSAVPVARSPAAVNERVPRPGTDHILIVGPAKTGTTGVYMAVKRGLQDAGIEARTVFEPKNAKPLNHLFALAPGVPVLTKTTMDRAARVVPEPRAFDRRIMTVRDPRDMVISTLLFRPLTVRSLRRTDSAVIEKFVAALEAKQADPSSMSVRQLFELSDELGIGVAPFENQLRNLRRQRDFMRRYPTHVVHYERFVRGELDDLSEYLGFRVENASTRESSMFGHIVRSQASGEFLQWFRPDDLAYFNEVFGEMLTAFDYPLDVDLPTPQTIAPETGSEYVRSRYRERRQNLAAAHTARALAWKPEDVASGADFVRLTEYASDGDATACVRAAEVILGGRVAEAAGGAPAALHWARLGAQLGNTRGMALTVRLLRQLAGDDADLQRELRRWTVELAVRRRRRSPEDRALIRQLETELESLRASASQRVGSALVSAARDPRHNTRAAIRELRAAWRARTSSRP